MNTISNLASMGPLGYPELVVILLIGVLGGVFGMLPFWFICKKAGFNPWLSILMLIPFGLVILPFIIAFSSWKIPEPESKS